MEIQLIKIESLYCPSFKTMKLRADQKLQIDPRQDLILYINDLHPYDYTDLKQSDSDEDSDDSNTPNDPNDPNNPNNEDEDTDQSEADSLRALNPFTVRAFCLTETGNSVSVDILGFQPYFYIKIPENWGQGQLIQLADRLRQLVYYQNRPGLLNIRKVLGKPFSHFTGDQKFQYAKLIFRNYQSFKSYSYCFNQPIKIPGLFRNGHKFEVFESNITPLLRLIHEKNIKPSGWIRLPGAKYHIDEMFIDPSVKRQCRRIPSIKLSEEPHGNSFCQAHLEINWQLLESLPNKLEIPAIIYAAYDIEADSSHGDFPLAKKTYQKLARELIQATQLSQTNVKNNYHKETQSSSASQRDIRSQIHRWLELAFDPYYQNNGIRHLSLDQPLTNPDSTYDQKYQHLNEMTQSIIRPLIESSIYPLAEAYHNARISETATDHLVDQVHIILETNLPLLNLEYPGIDYQTLGLQLIQEYHNSLIRNLKVVQTNPIECLTKWLSLAFDPIYDGEEINHVYTKNNQIPDPATLASLTPKVVEYCIQAVNNAVFDNPNSHNNKNDSQNDPSDPDDPNDSNNTNANATTYEMLLDNLLTKHLPPILGDQVIQIGTTFKRYGESDCFLKHIITLDTCDKIQNHDLIADEHKSVKLPKKVILQEIKNWMSDGLNLLAKRHNHHMSKYLINNILDFVDLDPIKFVESRTDASSVASPTDTSPIIRELDLGKLNREILDLRCKKQQATDKAEVIVESYATEREVLLAWARLIQRSDPEMVIGFNTFGFDFKFLYHRAEVLKCLEEFSQLGRFRGYQQELKEQKLSSSGLGDNLLYYIPMFGRVLIDLFKVVQANYKLNSYKLDSVCKEFMYMSKNDLPPKELFILQKGKIADRTKIARYCLIDCILCNRLVDKLEIITNNIGMSNVCSVPLSYLFLRGQGIKILSLVSKICAQEGFLLPVLKKPKKNEDKDDAAGFEGAIVLPAKKGVKFEPTVVNDFNSLYPSCMISENLSHDSFVIINSEWDNLPNYEYVSITYDVFEEVPTPPGKKKPKHPKKVKVGTKTCKFAQLPDGQKSMLPRILQHLLKARKDTRNEQKKVPKGSFAWNVLEGLQLAYKVTANSLYGQTGAITSDIFKKEIAACTTATGRKLIYFTRDFFEANYPGCTTVYGDTDSCFNSFVCKDIFGNPLKGLDAIYRSMEYAVEGSLAISRQLKPPHNLEFEKAINPFLLISKKRYTGLYYTEIFSPHATIKSMGIVLKRRDNAQIVKKVFGQILDIIIYEQDLEKALRDGRQMVEKVLNGEFPMDDFVISKTIRGWYKNPDRIAHAVLARRMAQRDPGNRPQSNDRIPYSFIKIPENHDKNVKILQGDRIETPEFIKEHDLKLDYRYYIVKQIMKPVCQIFELTEYDGQKYIFDEPLMDYDRRLKGIRKISEFFKPRDQNAIPRIAQYKKLSQFVPVKKTDSDGTEETDTTDDSDNADETDTENPEIDDPEAEKSEAEDDYIEEYDDNYADDDY